MKKNTDTKSVTLVELIVAIALFGAMVLGISSIGLFGLRQAGSINRQAIVENELAYALEHMSRNVLQGEGGGSQWPVERLGAGNGLRVRRAGAWVNYTLGQNPLRPNTLSCSINAEVLSNFILAGVTYGPMPNPLPANPSGFYINITDADPTDVVIAGALVEVGLVGRFQPGLAAGADNPQVSMKTFLYSRNSAAR